MLWHFARTKVKNCNQHFFQLWEMIDRSQKYHWTNFSLLIIVYTFWTSIFQHALLFMNCIEKKAIITIMSFQNRGWIMNSPQHTWAQAVVEVETVGCAEEGQGRFSSQHGQCISFLVCTRYNLSELCQIERTFTIQCEEKGIGP